MKLKVIYLITLKSNLKSPNLRVILILKESRNNFAVTFYPIHNNYFYLSVLKKKNIHLIFIVSAKQSSNGKYTEPATIAIHTVPSPVTGFDVDKWSLDSVKASWSAPKESIDYFELAVKEGKAKKEINFEHYYVIDF